MLYLIMVYHSQGASLLFFMREFNLHVFNQQPPDTAEARTGQGSSMNPFGLKLNRCEIFTSEWMG